MSLINSVFTWVVWKFIYRELIGKMKGTALFNSVVTLTLPYKYRFYDSFKLDSSVGVAFQEIADSFNHYLIRGLILL